MHAFVGVLIIKHLWLQAFKFVLHEVTWKKLGSFYFWELRMPHYVLYAFQNLHDLKFE